MVYGADAVVSGDTPLPWHCSRDAARNRVLLQGDDDLFLKKSPYRK